MQRLTAFIYAGIVMVALTTTTVRGQEQPAETTEPNSNPSVTPSSESAKDDLGASGLDWLGTGGRGMGGPGYAATWYPSRSISGSGSEGDFSLVRQDLSAAAPVWRKDGDSLSLSTGVRDSEFSTDVTLPDSHRSFPDELWNVRLGVNYLHKSDTDWSYGGGIYFGSASDKPFHSIDEMTFGFLSFLQVPTHSDRDAWRFMLMYSPVGNLNFPIPGVAYLWNPSDTFHASIGLPPALLWRPTERLTINLSYMPIATANARATYQLLEEFFVFGGFESLQESYFLADRDDKNDRFMGFEKRVIGGVRWDVWRHAALEAGGGYAFDRYYGTGQNRIDDLHDEVDIDPGPFLSASVRIRF
jgi:hypothetical protein